MQRNRIVTMKAGKLGQTTEDRQRESKVATTEKSITHKKIKFQNIKFICYVIYNVLIYSSVSINCETNRSLKQYTGNSSSLKK